jgi:polyphosphate kinase
MTSKETQFSANDHNLFLNRDLSWLKFNERVLYQATDAKTPLLERTRFLAIFSSNLDEFFMKRVGYLKRVSKRSVAQVGSDLSSPEKLLKEIRQVVKEQYKARHKAYEDLHPELKKQGIQFVKWSELTSEEKTSAHTYFIEKVFPILTPLAIDKAHPFPFLSNLSVSLGIVLMHPKTSKTLFARVKIPDVLPQWVQVNTNPKDGYRLMRLRDLISANLSELFPEMIVHSVMPFKVTRNADVGETSDDVEDRMDMVEEELRLRRIAQIVRIEYSKTEDESMLKLLQSELDLQDEEMYEVPGEVGYASLYEVANLNIPQLRYKPYLPVVPQEIKAAGGDMFAAIRKKDILVHHPYESFNESVEKFIRDAVRDPQVLAIKITLYRAGENNPIVPLLVEAAEQGKQIVCVVELQARFDEARNIYWGEILEKAGVHVVYGVIGKKIHSKTILVIRREGDNYKFYSHLGTGNYNPSTAKSYTDLSLFTADKKIGSELIEVFNFLTGLSLKKNYQKLMVAPVNMRKRFVQSIKREIEGAKKGEPSRIIAKMNSLEDQEICEQLYQASQAGVKIDLIVRGFCCLRPKVKGLSDNIRVFSTIGRFLEHSRIYYFLRGAKNETEGKMYVGSADWMYRNLNNRIETIVPIEDQQNKDRCWQILQYHLSDTNQTWELQSDGTYELLRMQNSEYPPVQERLMLEYSTAPTPPPVGV